MSNPKKIAAIVTEYRKHSHADVIVGKILEGYNYDGGAGPNLKVVSMYVDQFPATDMSRDLAKKHGFKLCGSIAEALTLGGAGLAVEGVVIVGEHGKYPSNDKGQVLYPRRRFFEEVTNVFAKVKKSVPVFNDKHLAAEWKDAKWMYDRARELFVPFLAGSSTPVTWRRPPLLLPKGCEIAEVLQLAYGPLEGYGFHALESLQCMVERRKGGETGVQAVTCLQGEAMFKALDDGRWSKTVLEEAFKLVPAHIKGDYRELTKKNGSGGVYLIEYRDGLRAAVAMLNGWLLDGSWVFGCRLKGEDKIQATNYYMQESDPFGHFAFLVRAIEHTIQTGHAAYPVERTLLTTGILDAVMTSVAERNRRVETPHLDIKYQPADWPFANAPGPKPADWPYGDGAEPKPIKR